MPLYHQNVPRTKKNLATTLGTLATSYMKGKQLGRQEAQKDVQNIMKNPQLAQYVDKDKLQKQVKRGYGGSSVTSSAISNALTEGGLAPTTEGTYRTIEQAREAGKNPPEGQRFTGEIEEYDVGGVTQYAPAFEPKEWELIEGKNFYWRYNSSTNEKEKTNIPVPPETTLSGVTFNRTGGSSVGNITKEKKLKVPEGVSEADIQHTMDKHNLTREEVLRRIQ